MGGAKVAGGTVAGRKVGAAVAAGGVAVAVSDNAVAVEMGADGVDDGKAGMVVGTEVAVGTDVAVAIGRGAGVGVLVVQPRRVSQKTAVNRFRIRRKRMKIVCGKKRTLA